MQFTVSCAFGHYDVIGLHVFPASITAESHKILLRTYLLPVLRRREVMNDVAFQQGGAVPPYSLSYAGVFT